MGSSGVSTARRARAGGGAVVRQAVVRQALVAPLAGLAIQIVVLAALDTVVHLSVVGWSAGIGYGVGLAALITWGSIRSSRPVLGPADRVTLGRATLVGAVTALAGDGLVNPPQPAPLAAIAVVALALDAVDGQVARRTGTASDFGARFDMETDAFLILMLSLFATTHGDWALAIGGMRYLYIAAAAVLPRLRDPLPPRFSRKVVAAVQGVMLLVVATGILPFLAGTVALAVALAALLWSFGRDVWWQLRPRRTGAGSPTAVAR